MYHTIGKSRICICMYHKMTKTVKDVSELKHLIVAYLMSIGTGVIVKLIMMYHFILNACVVL